MKPPSLHELKTLVPPPPPTYDSMEEDRKLFVDNKDLDLSIDTLSSLRMNCYDNLNRYGIDVEDIMETPAASPNLSTSNFLKKYDSNTMLDIDMLNDSLVNQSKSVKEKNVFIDENQNGELILKPSVEKALISRKVRMEERKKIKKASIKPKFTPPFMTYKQIKTEKKIGLKKGLSGLAIVHAFHRALAER